MGKVKVVCQMAMAHGKMGNYSPAEILDGGEVGDYGALRGCCISGHCCMRDAGSVEVKGKESAWREKSRCSAPIVCWRWV